MKEKIANLKKNVTAEFECGWMVDDVALFIQSLVRLYKPDLVIQTGHLWGKSALFILEALKENSKAPSLEEEPLSKDEEFYNYVIENSPRRVTGKLISVDPNIFKIDKEAIQFLRDKYPNFSFYEQTSKSWFDSNPDLEYENLIGIVDGDHTYKGCMDDLKSFNDLQAKIIVVDDTCWLPGLESCCRDFSLLYPYEFVNIPLYNGIGLLVRK